MIYLTRFTACVVSNNNKKAIKTEKKNHLYQLRSVRVFFPKNQVKLLLQFLIVIGDN